MKPFWKTLLFIFVAAGLVAGLIFAFIASRKEAAMEAEREKPIKAATRVEVVNGANVVTLDETTRTNSGVALASLAATAHRQEIRAYGVVIDLTGLTDLRNTIENAKAQLSKAKAALEVAQKDYKRVKALYDQNENVSQKTVQAAEGTLRAEQSNVQSAQAALTASQSTALQRWGRVVAGWLDRGAPEIERLRLQEDILVQVTISPDQAMVSAPAAASVQTADGQLIAVKFVSKALRTDMKIQGRSFFYLVSAEGALLPGMNVIALLPVGETRQGLVVPASAVVWLQGTPWAYVQVSPDRYVRREVSTEQPVSGGWFQSQGFSVGQRFIVKGPQVLLSEEFLAQISVLGEEGK